MEELAETMFHFRMHFVLLLLLLEDLSYWLQLSAELIGDHKVGKDLHQKELLIKSGNERTRRCRSSFNDSQGL